LILPRKIQEIDHDETKKQQWSLPPELILEILRILQQDVRDGHNIVWITVCRFVSTLWRDLLRPLPSLPEYLEPLSVQRIKELGICSVKEGAKISPITFAAVVCELGNIDLLIWTKDLDSFIHHCCSRNEAQ